MKVKSISEKNMKYKRNMYQMEITCRHHIRHIIFAIKRCRSQISN